MELCGRQSTVDIEDGAKSSEFLWNKVSLEQPTVPSAGDARYLTRLWVSEIEEPREQLPRPNSFQSISNGFELKPENFFSYHQEITYKIRSAFKQLTFRDQHVLVQFWSPRVVGKHQLLTTVDQPFGLGIAIQELCLYRRESEHSVYLVDKDHEEQDYNPPARVFRQGLLEWTFDITNYNPKDFPQQSYAIRCNLYGYMALPVFDSTTGLCVGVLELMTSSKYMSYAFEVQQIHKAFKTENLTSPQAFGCPASNVPHERKLDEIHSILKDVCDIYDLPLAQTWCVTPSSSCVSHKKVLEKSCSSFDTRCIGKVCMSSTGLPFNVRERRMWPYREASRKQHLEKSRGVVGTAFSSRGLCFCRDLTKLNEEEYPLVHYARMNKITGCLAIFLRSVEGNGDYVLEFVLPLDMINGGYVSLTKSLKQKFEVVSGFELGDASFIQEVGPSTDLSVDIIQTSSNCMAENSIFHSVSSASVSIKTDTATTDSASFPDQWSPMNRSVVNIDAQEKSNPFKQGKKRKIESDPLTFKVTFGKYTEKFEFDTSMGLSGLKSEVAQRFKLEGKDLDLKYLDEEADLILVACDADLTYAFDTLGSNISITFICSIRLA